MNDPLDWQKNRSMWLRVLEQNTGQGLDHWNDQVRRGRFEDEQSLRAWLSQQGVTGYAQTLLVMERFGYPDFLLASADQLIDGQYTDCPQLRPILDAILQAASSFGEVTVQARKTYVSLLTPRRTFARVQPTTRTRLDLALRLEGQEPGGRLQRSSIHETMKVQISFTDLGQFDAEARGLFQQAYDQNR